MKQKFIYFCCLVFSYTVLSSTLLAKPYVPQDLKEVLEKLPFKANDENSKELALFKKLMNTYAQANSTSIFIPLALANKYFDLAVSKGDTRYIGYAQAVIKPYLNSKEIGILLIHGQLLQYNHQFNEALTVFNEVLKISSDELMAHAWIANTLLVQGKYDQMSQSIDKLKALIDQSAYSQVLTAILQSQLDTHKGKVSTALKRYEDVLKITKEPETRVWILTRLGETETWMDNFSKANQYFKEAISYGIDDVYLLGAYSDLLLQQNRTLEVINLLKNWESSDILLLRLAIAEKIANSPKAKLHEQMLIDRFAAARMRNDKLHLTEEARFNLFFLANADEASKLALESFQEQKTYSDVRIMFESAMTLKDPSRAELARKWMKDTHFESPYLQKMDQSSKTVAAMALFKVRP